MDFSIFLIGSVHSNHRSASVKGKLHGFAALDSVFVDDCVAAAPIRKSSAAVQAADLYD